MTFYTGNILTSNTPALQLAMVVDPTLITEGYVKVSTNVAANIANATSGGIFNVYKSPAANNACGNDWFLAIGWDNVTNSNLYITVFESWNTSTNNASAFVPNVASVTPNLTYNVPFAANTLSSSNLYVATSNTMPTNDGITYNYSINIDRLILAEANTSNTDYAWAAYAGLYDSFLSPTADPIPLLVNVIGAPATPPQLGTSGPQSGSGGATREPLKQEAASPNFSTAMSPTMFPVTVVDPYTQKFAISRLLVAARGVSTAFRGLYKDVYTAQGTAHRFDTVNFTVAGNTFTVVNFTSPTSLASGVQAGPLKI